MLLLLPAPYNLQKIWCHNEGKPLSSMTHLSNVIAITSWYRWNRMLLYCSWTGDVFPVGISWVIQSAYPETDLHLLKTWLLYLFLLLPFNQVTVPRVLHRDFSIFICYLSLGTSFFFTFNFPLQFITCFKVLHTPIKFSSLLSSDSLLQYLEEILAIQSFIMMGAPCEAGLLVTTITFFLDLFPVG